MPGEGLLANRPTDWNNYMSAFWVTGRGRTKRYNIRIASGSVDGIFATVLRDSTLGLGIKFINPDPTSPSAAKIKAMIQLGVYNGRNDAEFVGIIMSDILRDVFNDADVFKIAFSIGREPGGDLIVLVDSVDSADRLIGKGDGPGGDNLTPCRIPAP